MAVNVQRASMIPGYMPIHELTWLAMHARSCQVVVEIGSWKGRSTRAMGDNVGRDRPDQRGRVYAVDHWLGQLRDPAAAPTREILVKHGGDGSAIRKQFDDNVADLARKLRVVAVEANSQDGIPSVLQRFMGRIDMLFIDGDHSAIGVLTDIAMFSPLLRDGGLLCGHDYNNQPRHAGVRQVVDALFGNAAQKHATIWWLEINDEHRRKIDEHFVAATKEIAAVHSVGKRKRRSRRTRGAKP